jgi:hypothetical protein
MRVDGAWYGGRKVVINETTQILKEFWNLRYRVAKPISIYSLTFSYLANLRMDMALVW